MAFLEHACAARARKHAEDLLCHSPGQHMKWQREAATVRRSTAKNHTLHGPVHVFRSVPRSGDGVAALTERMGAGSARLPPFPDQARIANFWAFNQILDARQKKRTVIERSLWRDVLKGQLRMQATDATLSKRHRGLLGPLVPTPPICSKALLLLRFFSFSKRH
jgi:hypothetical protein